MKRNKEVQSPGIDERIQNMMGLSRSPFSFAPSKEINEAPGVITSNS